MSAAPTRRRPSFRDAIDWMASNDDTEWAIHDAADPEGAISVTGALVADLFGRTDEEVRAALYRRLQHADDPIPAARPSGRPHG